MRVEAKDPPRTFTCGEEPHKVTISDCGNLLLAPDEQVTFVTESGAEFDVARKNFGFYATPSLNGRLPQKGLRPALVSNASGRIFVLLVEPAKSELFDSYLAQTNQRVVVWLDEEAALKALMSTFSPAP